MQRAAHRLHGEHLIGTLLQERVAASIARPEIAEHAAHRVAKLFRRDRIDQLARRRPRDRFAVLAHREALDHPVRAVVLEAERAFVREMRMPRVRPIPAPQRGARDVRALEHREQAPPRLQLRVHRRKPLDVASVELVLGDDDEVDVARCEREIARGKRPVQIEPDDARAELLAHASEQHIEDGRDFGRDGAHSAGLPPNPGG